MKATEKRLLEEATRKQDEHDRQTTAIQRAKMDAQSQYDAFLADSQRRNDELYKKVQELQSYQTNLQMKVTSLQRTRRPVTIVTEKRRCTIQ